MTKRYVLFQNGGVGDFLMALFLAEELRDQGGAERVYILLHRRAAFLRAFAADYSYVSVVEISGRDPRTFVPVLKLAGPDTVVIMPPTIGAFPLKVKFFSWMLSRMWGGTLIGFQDKGNCSLYSRVLPYKLDQDFAESMRDAVRALGLSPSGKPPRLHIEPTLDFLNRMNLIAGDYIVLHPRGAAAKRQLTTEESLHLIRCIRNLSPKSRVVISGAEHERREVEEIISISGDTSVQAVIGGSPAELAALIRGAELFVGMDTGITHLACFLGQKVLLIAKGAQANWLPYYHDKARVLYRLEEEGDTRTDRKHLLERQEGRIRPFGDIPMEAVCREIKDMLKA